MTPKITTLEQIKMLDIEAREWIGTPFAANARVKKGGADCVGLVAGIYIAIGVLKKFEPGKYSIDEGLHGEESKVLKWFANHPEFIQIVNGDPQPGDCLCFRFDKMEHHVGLMLEGGEFIHLMAKRFAIVSSMKESFYKRRITAIYRPISI